MGGNRSSVITWLGVAAAACLLGLLSVLPTIDPVEQVIGQGDGWQTARIVCSMLLNSGTVWAGFPILLGWWVRDVRTSWLAGLVGTHLALISHYAIGRLFGIFEPAIWAENSAWFILATVVGPALGFAGAMIHRRDVLGMMTSMLIPAGAFFEPVGVGMFFTSPFLPEATRSASALSGLLLMALGLISAIAVAIRRKHLESTSVHEQPRSSMLTLDSAL